MDNLQDSVACTYVVHYSTMCYYYSMVHYMHE